MLFSVAKTGEKFQNLEKTASLRLPYGNLNLWRAQIIRNSRPHSRLVEKYRAPEWTLNFHDILLLGLSCFPLRCANLFCRSSKGSPGEATHGGHVVRVDRRKKGVFIAPLCRSCNLGPLEEFELYGGCPLLLVIRKKRFSSSKNTHFAAATVRLLRDQVKLSLPVST